MAYRNFWTMCAAASATAVVVGAAAPTALAQQQDTTIVGRAVDEEARSVRVVYGDLNLAAARGERILISRVRGAARSACQPVDGRWGVGPYSRCVSIAWNDALPQVDLAVQRAREIASRGSSSIPLVAIAVVGTR